MSVRSWLRPRTRELPDSSTNPQSLTMLADICGDRRRLAREPSAALRARLPAGATRAERGAQGRSEGIGSGDDTGRRSSGCRWKAVCSASRLRRHGLRDRGGEGGRRLPGSQPVCARVPGTVSPFRFDESVHSRGRGSIPAGSSARRRIPGRQASCQDHRWQGTRRSTKPKRRFRHGAILALITGHDGAVVTELRGCPPGSRRSADPPERVHRTGCDRRRLVRRHRTSSRSGRNAIFSPRWSGRRRGST